MSKEAMKRISDKLKKAGATLPAPQATGTIKGSMITGLCIALAIVEQEIEALAEQPAQQEPEIVQRVKRFAGQTMRTARNPNITARECIELANWIAANTHGITGEQT